MQTVTTAQMKAIEKQADSHGLSYPQMMENAGAAAVRVILEQKPELRYAAIFAGRGNNGGDGFVAARLLREHGCSCAVILVEGEPKTPDAISNLQKLRQTDVPVWNLTELTMQQLDWIFGCSVIIDAMVGTGFSGELRENTSMAAQLINQSLAFVVAFDLPTGVNADTGVAAQHAIQADLTIAFHRPKPAHESAKMYCSITEVVDIGIDAVLGDA
ncbi:MAG: NAD(P)H-hydrate epimerase [Butyricicoccaceae bacterium]